jgi:hypothetical protein
MKYLIRFIIIVFITALIGTQVHSIVRYFDPGISRFKVNLFWDRTYKRDVTVQWYLFFLFQYFFLIACMFIGAMACIRYSFRLSILFTLGFAYWLFKLVLFAYNYDSSGRFDWALVTVLVISLLMLTLKEPKGGKYKSLI